MIFTVFFTGNDPVMKLPKEIINIIYRYVHAYYVKHINKEYQERFGHAWNDFYQSFRQRDVVPWINYRHPHLIYKYIFSFSSLPGEGPVYTLPVSY